jgi:acyl-CoA synthetase (NDP forming)
VRQPDNFIAAIDQARQRGIAVIALKLGRSARGQEFAKSHSGAMSGSAAVYDAVFERHGVISVRSLDELMDTAELFAGQRRPHNGLIGLGCDSGGERQLIADLSEPLGLPFATLSEGTVVQLQALLDPGIEVANPLDYWGDGKDVIADALLGLAADPSVGTLVMATNIPDGQDFTSTCSSALEKTFAGTTKPVVLMGNVANTMSPTECQRYRKLGIPVLMGTETALRALKHYANFHTPPAPQGDLTISAAITPERLTYWRGQLQDAAQRGSTVQSFALLEDFGLPVAASVSTANLSDGLLFSTARGYPLVAKIDAPDVAHKSDIGGVILGIASDEALTAAFAKLQAIAPGPVLLQQQMAGTELILGMQHDPQFGPTFTVGFGGIFVEILKDFVTLLPGAGAAHIEARLRSLKTYPLLSGARGRPATNMTQLIQVVQRFMAMGLALQDDVAEMEINPLLVDGERLAAVDLLVIPRQKANP